MIVCIAEKPSVAMEIAKILGANSRHDGYMEGNGYQVTWTFGHLCQLCPPESYNPEWKKWSLEGIPMLPSSYNIKVIDNEGIKKQFKTVKQLFSKATEIVNCGDAGQEGELIQRWVMSLCKVKCPVKRLWISSLTEEAIREGFKHLKPQSDYDPLYKAGQARAIGDWVLGMNATRLYTLKYAPFKKTYSIGRVQTPTLAMVVNRDLEIENFKPTPYWVITTDYRKVTFTCEEGKFSDEAKAKTVLNSIIGNIFRITSVEEKRGVEQPPQLYDLTSLQVDCNKKFGMSADATLKTVQSLYEKKVTTYPRVDTKYLSDDIFAKCPGILKNLTGYSNYTTNILNKALIKRDKVFNSSKVTDHHAIIPTGEPLPENLTSNESKVYDLIARRFIAEFMPACGYAKTIVTARCASYNFKVTGKTILSPGWQLIYSKLTTDEQEEKKEGEVGNLPRFIQGEAGEHSPALVKKMTNPPKRFTEATLLQSMETAGKLVDNELLQEVMKENGIGRPSSRAGIIETLIKREYIKRERKNIVSTPIGRELMNIVKYKMLKSPELTGEWEHKLRQIERGAYTKEQFMNELTDQIVKIVSEVKQDPYKK